MTQDRKDELNEEMFAWMLVFDVLCLLHTYDYVYAGDYGDEELEQQVTAFKKK